MIQSHLMTNKNYNPENIHQKISRMTFSKAFHALKKNICLIKSYDIKREEVELKLYNGILSLDFSKKVQCIKCQ